MRLRNAFYQATRIRQLTAYSVLTLLVLLLSNTFSQATPKYTLNKGVRVPISIPINGIENSSNSDLVNPYLLFELPTGVEFIDIKTPLTISGTNPPVVDVDGIIINNNTAKIPLVGTLKKGATIAVEFTRIATCDAVIGGVYKDKVQLKHPSINSLMEFSSVTYPIIAPKVEAFPTDPAIDPINITVGDSYDLNGNIKLIGSDDALTTSFTIDILHAGFRRPTSITLKNGSRSISPFTTEKTSTTATVSITQAMLKELGFTNGYLVLSDNLEYTLPIAPIKPIVEADCRTSGTITIQISNPTTSTSGCSQSSQASRNFNIHLPGIRTDNITFKRTTFDFADELNNHTRNGNFGGNAMPDLTLVKNGDEVELIAEGTVFTSAILPTIKYLYADFSFSNPSFSDAFDWDRSVDIEVQKKDGTNITVTKVNFEISTNTSSNGVTYFSSFPSNISLENGDRIQLKVKTTVKENISANGNCSLYAELLGAESRQKPTNAPCESKDACDFRLVRIIDHLSLQSPSIIASCSGALSTFQFESKKGSVEKFDYEFRSVNLLKEVRIYIPTNASISQVKFTDISNGSTIMPANLGSATTISYTPEGESTASPVKRYIVDLSSYYGDYETSSVFTDELAHTVKIEVSLSFESIVNNDYEVKAVWCEITTANPKTSRLATTQTVKQPISFLTLQPKIEVITGESEVRWDTKTAKWEVSISNDVTADNLNDLILELVPETAGAISNLKISYDPSLSLPPASASELEVKLEKLEKGKKYKIYIEATVNEAEEIITPIELKLKYPSCKPGGEPKTDLATTTLTYKRLNPTFVLDIVRPVITEVSMCEHFDIELKLKVDGIMSNGYLNPDKLEELFVEIVPQQGIDFVGVRKSSSAVMIMEGDGRVERTPEGVKLNFYHPDYFEDGNNIILGGNNELNFIVTYKTNCNFSNKSEIFAIPQATYFTNKVNSEDAKYTASDLFTMPGLECTLQADISLVAKTHDASLIFDKENKFQAASLTIELEETSDLFAAHPNAELRLRMPSYLKVNKNPKQDIIQGNTRIVSWNIDDLFGKTDGIDPLQTNVIFTFEPDDIPLFNDTFEGVVKAEIVNRIEVTCNEPGKQPSPCPGVEVVVGEASISYKLADIYPAVAKKVKVVRNSLLDFTISYTYSLKNWGKIPTSSTLLTDNLSEFYNKGTISDITLSSSNPSSIIVNEQFNGKEDNNLLQAHSVLQAEESQTASVSFNIAINEDFIGEEILIEGMASTTCTNENGTQFINNSNDGDTPLLDAESPTITRIYASIPELEFVLDTANSDKDAEAITGGVKCLEGDGNPNKVLRFFVQMKNNTPAPYKLRFYVKSVENTAKESVDYQPVLAEILIEAGDIQSQNSFEVEIIGNTFYEDDKELFLTLALLPNDDNVKIENASILILNDDVIPGLDIKLDDLHDFKKIEGTSPSPTIFTYTVTLSAPASTPYTLRVVSGAATDTATPDKDYASINEDFQIAIGEVSKVITIKVAADDIPENDEVFTLSFGLLQNGSLLQEKEVVTTIVDDDEFKMPSELLEVIYCPYDDEATQHAKLEKIVDGLVSSKYKARWYESISGGIQIPTKPTVNTNIANQKHTFYISWVDEEENYEAPDRKKVTLYVQPEPKWTVNHTPLATPIKLYIGQSVNISVEPAEFFSYEYTLNNIVKYAGEKSNTQFHTSSLINRNDIKVSVTDLNGCIWVEELMLDVIIEDLPNAFIPQGDDPDNKRFLEGLDITVFNRWGHLLYQGIDGWDGRYRGAYVTPGTYFYIMKYIDEDGNQNQVKGSVHVINPRR